MEINYTAPINTLSYGICGLNILNALDKQGVKVNLWPIGQIDCTDQQYYPLLQKTIDNQSTYNKLFDSVRLYHEFDLAQHVGAGNHVGFPIFEVNKFNQRRLHHLRRQDKLLVCSKWAKKVCEDNGLIQPIYVAPLGVDRNIFFEKEKNKQVNNVCRFIHLGKREYRKSQWEMLQCFEKAFIKEDNVSLTVCWGSLILEHTNKKEHDSWTELFKKSKMASRINLLEWVSSQNHIAHILRDHDCGIFLSKAEGFNLGLLESMSCGNKNIVLNYSGPTEFCNQDNSFIVDKTKEEFIYDGVWFQDSSGGDGTWAAFGQEQEEQTIHYMREVYRQHQEGISLFNQEGVVTAKEFSWENTAKKLVEALQ